MLSSKGLARHPFITFDASDAGMLPFSAEVNSELPETSVRQGWRLRGRMLSQTPWVWILAQPRPGWVPLGKSLNSAAPQCS